MPFPTANVLVNGNLRGDVALLGPGPVATEEFSARDDLHILFREILGSQVRLGHASMCGIGQMVLAGYPKPAQGRP